MKRKKYEAAQKLETMKDPTGFLKFYHAGGVHKAVKRDGWAKIREIAVTNKVAEEIIQTMDIIFS